MNSISNSWDSTKRGETKKGENNGGKKKKTLREWISRRIKQTNIYPYVYMHTTADIQTYT